MCLIIFNYTIHETKLQRKGFRELKLFYMQIVGNERFRLESGSLHVQVVNEKHYHPSESTNSSPHGEHLRNTLPLTGKFYPVPAVNAAQENFSTKSELDADLADPHFGENDKLL